MKLITYTEALYMRFQTIILFLVSGGTAALFQLIVYIILSDILHLQYLIASSLAFSLAVVLSFLLQKYVAFGHKDHSKIPQQFSFFLVLAVFNLGANGFGMYVFVEHIGFHDILAQILCMGTIAIWSFFIYRYGIFKKSPAILPEVF